MQDGHVIVFPSSRGARVDKMASTLEQAHSTILQFHWQVQQCLNSTFPPRRSWRGTDEDEMWCPWSSKFPDLAPLEMASFTGDCMLTVWDRPLPYDPGDSCWTSAKRVRSLERFSVRGCYIMLTVWFLWFFKHLHFILNYTLYFNNYWLGFESR
jgi:hypothetical protein